MALSTSKSTAFSQIAPTRTRLAGYEYIAFPVDPVLPPPVPDIVSIDFTSEYGTATLCGYSEFASPSTPPKKYLRLTCSGGWRYGLYVSCPPVTPACAGHDSAHSDYSGFNEYDPNTCVLAVGATYDSQFSCNGSTSSGPLPSGCTSPADCLRTLSVSQTVKQNGMTGACCASGPNFASMVYTNNADTLSLEDTEDDAISRSTPSGTGISKTSYKETRGAGDFSFLWQNSTANVTTSSLVIGDGYLINIDILTEDYGGGSPVYSTISFPFTASAESEIINVPITASSGTQVTALTVTIEHA